MISFEVGHQTRKCRIPGTRVRKLVQLLFLLLACCLIDIEQVHLAVARDNEITIHNRGEAIPYRATNFEVGSTDVNSKVNLGNILNAHYFPGLEFYRHGTYVNAKNEMDYFIDRPSYTENNPRHAEYLSNAHYVRGAIYLYHASGLGRHLLAKRDFEQSIRWNPKNYASYLELSRIWAAVGKKEQAVSILRRLLDLKPDETVLEQARKDLAVLQSGKAE